MTLSATSACTSSSRSAEQRCPAERKDEVISALNAAGYASLDVREKGPWCAIAARVD